MTRIFRILALTLCVGAFAGPRLLADETPDNGWAYAKPVRPAVPVVSQKSWPRNPIDSLLLARLEKQGLKPNAEADRVTLLKRIVHDLTGLAPTAQQREAFLNDKSPDAYEKLVDRLLASPQFGERQAQHWLDLVRYSESEGFKMDRYRPIAWRYRDYVIRAFNADLPYDRFMRQQIAGDEIEPDNPEAILATGFLRLHPEETNGANYRQIRQDILDDVTEVTALTFLGLTVGCARCHDHKFDPISHADHYRFQAFFAGMKPRDEAPLLHGKEEKEFSDRMEAWQVATRDIRAEMQSLLNPVGKQVFSESVVALDEETQIALKTPEDQRTPMQMQLAAYGGKQIQFRYEKMHRRLQPEQKARYNALKQRLDAFDKIKPSQPTAMAVSDTGPTSPPIFRLGGGDYRRPKQEMKPAFPECLDKTPPTIEPLPQSSGRRRALALWLSRPDHPLAGRVIVNRLWQQYFGTGIVGTPSDFGVMGRKPTHPEIIDLLATELVDKGWSLKTIHRLIATSAAYRQDSAPEHNPTALEAAKSDPENRLLWHQRVRRRDAEAIRDAVLQASGSLNPRMFDESACPELPPALSSGSRAWLPDEKVEDRNRRSIYVFSRRNLVYPLFAAFDGPNRSLSCATRISTATAPQALLMLNGEFSTKQAKAMADKIHGENKGVRAFAREAYLRALSREPSSDEIDGALAFVEKQSKRLASESIVEPERAALVDLCHALLNGAEFLTID